MKGKSLSASDISKELNIGKSFIKYLLRRFQKWLPCEQINGFVLYLPQSIQTITRIIDHIEDGILPGEIEIYLDMQSDSLQNQIFNPAVDLLKDEDIRLNKEGVTLLKSLFYELGEQQKRIAAAHEKRAEAEQRKAIAIEKRAEAEEKKAEAMNNIAIALQEMNRLRSETIDSSVQAIVHQTAKAMILEETQPPYQNINMDDPLSESIFDDDADENHIISTDYTDQSNLIDHFSKIDEHIDPDPFDPLYEYKENKIKNDFKTDDLYLLIDHEPLADEMPANLDDLSALIAKDADSVVSFELDDLSALIDKSDFESSEIQEMDDLSLLVMPDTGMMDDLSLLIDTPAETPAAGDMDDLSLLLDMDDSSERKMENDAPMDDLSKLIDLEAMTMDFTPEKELIKPSRTISMNLSPDDNIEKYKAAIMKTILELKNEGYSPEETTYLLNENKIRTLSGKPEWSEKAIHQIYKFICQKTNLS